MSYAAVADVVRGRWHTQEQGSRTLEAWVGRGEIQRGRVCIFSGRVSDSAASRAACKQPSKASPCT
jgi:hypothetical protein